VNRLLTFLLLLFSVIAGAQAPHVKSGAAVYIEPMNGYETYLAAAKVKKRVPLVVVADKDKADYIIRSSFSQTRPNQPAVVVNNTNTNVNNGNNNAWGRGWAEMAAQRAAREVYTSASIAMIDGRSSQIVFAYSAGKGGINGSAEDCSKHLKQFIERAGKQ